MERLEKERETGESEGEKEIQESEFFLLQKNEIHFTPEKYHYLKNWTKLTQTINY